MFEAVCLNMHEYAGWPINWAMGSGAFNIKMHPLYIKYNAKSFDTITKTEVQTDLGGCLATSEGAVIVSYLSWLIRTLNLLA